MKFTAYEVICLSEHRHWPDALVTLQLAATCARLDQREVDPAIRACAALLAYRLKNKNLQSLLLSIVISDRPSNLVLTVKDKVDAMVKSLRKNGGDTFEADSPAELMQALKKPVIPFIPYLVKR